MKWRRFVGRTLFVAVFLATTMVVDFDEILLERDDKSHGNEDFEKVLLGWNEIAI